MPRRLGRQGGGLPRVNRGPLLRGMQRITIGEKRTKTKCWVSGGLRHSGHTKGNPPVKGEDHKKKKEPSRPQTLKPPRVNYQKQKETVAPVAITNLQGRSQRTRERLRKGGPTQETTAEPVTKFQEDVTVKNYTPQKGKRTFKGGEVLNRTPELGGGL